MIVIDSVVEKITLKSATIATRMELLKRQKRVLKAYLNFLTLLTSFNW